MRIAVLGGGTAGFVAAAHFTRNFPQEQLLHIFDSNIPTIGVGEGTTPRFPGWFEEVTGLGFSELAARCRATLKRGTRFDGWGERGTRFLHRFQPVRLIGYHFDAAQLVHLLAEHVRAERIDARVTELRTRPDGVDVRLADGAVHDCDYVFDARGFPSLAQETESPPDDLIQIDWIPTGRAILRWLPPQPLLESTRAAARPHGWIFQIPLRDATSCGYIFNPRISSDAEIEADFTAFLHEEGVSGWNDRGRLNFPNFVRCRMFDGGVFHGGNAACFLEPLEATAIGTAILHVRLATRWIVEHGAHGRADPDEVEYFNQAVVSYVCRDSLFLAWHYACGSRWDTPFWRYARQGMERARNTAVARPHLAAMQEFVEAGRSLPGLALSEYQEQDRWEREVYPLLRLYRAFGNFSELNFSQIGHGIGYYDAGTAERNAATVGARLGNTRETGKH
jgi:2-polyprenyl-6-methoxyphenol hydroxylase-like FAD-dependent oxidoreductase